MVRDHDQTRPHIRKALIAQIEILCNEAVQVHQSLPLYHEPTLESPRIQILQRLTNLCVVLEGMGSEGRRQTNEFMKEILNEETIENLVKAFACTLPASRQLLAQLRYVTFLSSPRTLFFLVKLLSAVLLLYIHILWISICMSVHMCIPRCCCTSFCLTSRQHMLCPTPPCPTLSCRSLPFTHTCIQMYAHTYMYTYSRTHE